MAIMHSSPHHLAATRCTLLPDNVLQVMLDTPLSETMTMFFTPRNLQFYNVGNPFITFFLSKHHFTYTNTTFTPNPSILLVYDSLLFLFYANYLSGTYKRISFTGM